MNYETILTILSIGALTFGAFMFFRNPQEKLDKDTGILAQQVQWEKEATAQRFSEMSKRMEDALVLAQNHTHTVDVKVDSLIGSVNSMNLQLSTAIAKLETTINERIPKKI